MANYSDWVSAARPRTLAVALSAVAVGIGVARATGHVDWWHALFALVVALAMQIGTNYANDYSDGVRGTDTRRVGPVRLVASGRASPFAVKRAALVTFAIGAVFGLVLSLVTSPWLILLGAASVAAGWLYTGGPHPYGYLGLGEVFVFCFFGLFAVVGTAYVSSGSVPSFAWIAASAIGFLAVALLVVNNLRDRVTDQAAGKKTLAVKLGDRPTRVLYVSLIAGAFGLALGTAVFRGFALLALVGLPFALRPAAIVVKGAEGAALVPALVLTTLLQVVFGVAFAFGVAI
ncbi:MAG: 1,4-dihydroxy-2-naphthoate polyprenyltransferase [Acidimicrobiales bacterium]